MRLVILFLVSIFFSCGRAEENAKLLITISDDRSPDIYAILDEIKILKDGNDFRTIDPDHHKTQVLKNLEFGTYTISYESIFDHEEQIIVEITENKTYETNINISYIDYSKATHLPIIDQLGETDSYSIITASQGCFHSDEDTMTIVRQQEVYTITWGADSKILTPDDIELIRHFEIELANINYGNYGCTTTDTYTVLYHQFSKQITDGGCRWDGHHYLRRQLFGKI